jgi:3',5'-cyclic AMP phosphodiesterase CpdA
MPKIVIASDLHLGITTVEALRLCVEEIAAEQPALTVLAGDLGEPLDMFVACLQLFAALPGQVAVLAGNHDVWAREGYSSEELWEKQLPEAVRSAGMLWLEEGCWQQDGFAVAGSLAWYDYSAADAEASLYPAELFAAFKGRFNNDARYIDWSWSDQEFAARLGDALCERLQGLEADPAVRSIVLATHVPLFDEQMIRKPGDSVWGFSNAYFGNLTLGQRVLGLGKLRQVVSGHTHLGREDQVARQVFGLPSLPVTVIASEYGAPGYVVIDSTRLDGKPAG